MNAFIEHAHRELELIGYLNSDDEYTKRVAESVMEIIHKFDGQGHSGFSAGITTQLIEKLLRFEPIAPLTGKDDEWNDVGGGLYQNKRCGRVFKDENGAYDIEGKVFVDPDGMSVISRGSNVPVEFPYIPKTQYVRRDEEGNEIGPVE